MSGIENTPTESVQDSTLRSRSITERAKLGLGVTSFAVQQSPANEAVRAWAALNVYAETGSPILAGATVGAITLAVEGTTGMAIANSLRSEDGALQKIRDRMGAKGISRNRHGNRASDITLALGIGSGAIVAKRHLGEKNRTLRNDLSTTARASTVIAGFSAGVASLATGGVEYAERFGFEQTAEVSVAVLSDWRTYVGAIALTQGYGYARNKLSGRSKKHES
jgi:hypothetical protein